MILLRNNSFLIKYILDSYKILVLIGSVTGLSLFNFKSLLAFLFDYDQLDNYFYQRYSKISSIWGIKDITG